MAAGGRNRGRERETEKEWRRTDASPVDRTGAHGARLGAGVEGALSKEFGIIETRAQAD